MSSLKQKIQSDLKEAMLKKDTKRVSTLRLVLTAILVKEKEKRAKLSKTEKNESKLTELSQLDDKEVLGIFASEAKKRKDSIEQFTKGNRQDLVDKETDELDILKEYLPEEMPEDNVRKIVEETIKKIGAKGQQDTGKVMAAVMAELKGRADGTLVSKIVKEKLG